MGWGEVGAVEAFFVAFALAAFAFAGAFDFEAFDFEGFFDLAGLRALDFFEAFLAFAITLLLTEADQVSCGWNLSQLDRIYMIFRIDM